MLKSLNKKWKEFKTMLKRDVHKKKGLIENNVAHICPPNVDPHQWRELVHYWFFERGYIIVYTHHVSYIILINNINCICIQDISYYLFYFVGTF